MYIDQFWKLTHHQGVEPKIEMNSCNFVNNSDKFYEKKQNHRQAYELGIGALYISSSSIIVIDIITFTDNSGSALAISDSNVILENCVATFTGNQGSSGAALVLLGTSTIDLGKGTEMTFENNTALIQGGAIYAEWPSRKTKAGDPNCFIRYMNSDIDFTDSISMIFINNRDHDGGNINSIHATSLLPCANFLTNYSSQEKAGVFCLDGWEYYDESLNSSECDRYISSDIGHLNLAVDNRVATPGWAFKLPIDITDDLNASIASDDVFFNLKYKGNNLEYKDIHFCQKDVTIKADQNSAINLTLTAVGERVWSMDITVSLRECPPGFFLMKLR